MKWLFLFFISINLLAQVPNSNEEYPYTPEEIEEELQDAQNLYEEAQRMFTPWYTGPLITGSATVMKPGKWNIQPYIFVTDNYATYDSKRNTVNTPDTLTINPQLIIQTGLTSFMDVVLILQGTYNENQDESSMNFGDTSLSVDFALLEEKPFIPGIAIGIQETFPTGKYDRLNPNKNNVQATGEGSYQTTFAFKFSKVLWWWWLSHPMSARFNFTWTIPSIVHVKGFNVYGGGFGTDGKIRPGFKYSADIGYEFSFTRNWAFALDVVYEFDNEITFSGSPGTSQTGETASNGAGSSDVLSLAPAIEYNPLPNLGMIGGAWFTVYGRNATKFASAIVSITYAF